MKTAQLIVSSVLVGYMSLGLSSCIKTEPLFNQGVEHSLEISDPKLSKALGVRNQVATKLSPIVLDVLNDYKAKGIIDNDFFEERAKESGYITTSQIELIYSTLRSANINAEISEAEVQKQLGAILSPALSSSLISYLNLGHTIMRDREIESLSKQAKDNLSSEEYKTYTSIVETIEGTLDAFRFVAQRDSGKHLKALRWRGWYQEVSMLACNAATAGVGSVWGSMAGAVAVAAGAGTILTGGVGAVVGFGVSYALSRMACPS